MRRIRNSVEIDDQEVGRWLISYADFITLLFAFFVVLYSISQLNAKKYKELSKSFEAIFDQPLKSPRIVSIGDLSKSLQPVSGDDIEQPELEKDTEELGQIDSESFATAQDFKDLEQGLEASLGDLIDQDLAEINSDTNWINIVLKSGLLFPSGSDVLNVEAEPLMEELSKHLNRNRQIILVHGHTDDIPIETEKFPSNWELSSARGVAVVRKLQQLNIQPNRLSVEGHGEYHPIADNNTSEGRQKNRRVVIAISRKQEAAEWPNNNLSNRAILNATTKEKEPKYDIIKLPGGGILIRGKEPKRRKSKKDG